MPATTTSVEQWPRNASQDKVFMKEIKLTFVNSSIPHVRNSKEFKDTFTNLLPLIKEFSKIAGYNVIFLHITANIK